VSTGPSTIVSVEITFATSVDTRAIHLALSDPRIGPKLVEVRVGQHPNTNALVRLVVTAATWSALADAAGDVTRHVLSRFAERRDALLATERVTARG
jgi:hypothetical protein